MLQNEVATGGEVRTEEAERAGSKEMMDEQHHPHLPSRYIYLSPGSGGMYKAYSTV